ncbi:MAG: XdhC family protein [Treponema sp.]|nr:XdhC family protein [Treponema sp.]
MKDLFLAARAFLLEKEDLILASIIRSSGSTPRGAGAKMLAGREGRIAGTIGGAAAEHLAVEESKKLIAEKRSARREYILRPNEAADIGAKCGGEVSVYFAYLDSGDPALLPFIDAVLSAFSAGGPSWLFTRVDEGGADGASGTGGRAVMGAAGEVSAWLGAAGAADAASLCGEEPVLALKGGSLWFCEALVPSGFVYVFGGGHVAQALVPLLAGLDFRCVVFDDRGEFTKPELFPDAVKIITGDFSDPGSLIRLSEKDYAVIVTRGHVWDVQAEAFALRSNARYIGIIGSASKHEFVRGRLSELGFTPGEINASRVHAPVGVPIGSRTPAEIAVSIAAELIRERSGFAGGA